MAPSVVDWASAVPLDAANSASATTTATARGNFVENLIERTPVSRTDGREAPQLQRILITSSGGLKADVTAFRAPPAVEHVPYGAKPSGRDCTTNERPVRAGGQAHQLRCQDVTGAFDYSPAPAARCFFWISWARLL